MPQTTESAGPYDTLNAIYFTYGLVLKKTYKNALYENVYTHQNFVNFEI